MRLRDRDIEDYYCAQVGGGDSAYFQGITHQRGYGFFGDLKRYITPLAMRAGRYLAKNLFQTGKNVISDVASGSSFKQAARTRIGEASKNIQKDIFEKLQQQGRGIKRKRKNKTRQLKTKRQKISRDIFD